MKKIFLGVLTALALISCAYAAASPARAEAKSIVIVFSRADENYGVGYIEKGNTMILAEMIAEKTGSELFEVKPAKPYPKAYDECTDVAKREQNQKARPAILEDKDISEYDTVYLGYPVWWGDIPMCMYTFIEAHDWSGKKVLPFCTHEGSSAGRTEGTLKRIMKGAEVTRPLAVYGTVAQNNREAASESVSEWLKKGN